MDYSGCDTGLQVNSPPKQTFVSDCLILQAEVDDQSALLLKYGVYMASPNKRHAASEIGITPLSACMMAHCSKSFPSAKTKNSGTGLKVTPVLKQPVTKKREVSQKSDPYKVSASAIKSPSPVHQKRAHSPHQNESSSERTRYATAEGLDTFTGSIYGLMIDLTCLVSPVSPRLQSPELTAPLSPRYPVGFEPGKPTDFGHT